MSEEKKSNRITAHYATDEDYKRMNFYTIGTLYRSACTARTSCSTRAVYSERCIFYSSYTERINSL